MGAGRTQHVALLFALASSCRLLSAQVRCISFDNPFVRDQNVAVQAVGSRRIVGILTLCTGSCLPERT